MLIASAPWSTAQTIDAATLESREVGLDDEQAAAEARRRRGRRRCCRPRRPATRRACRGRSSSSAGGACGRRRSSSGPATRPASSGWRDLGARVDHRDARARCRATGPRPPGSPLRARPPLRRSCPAPCAGAVSGATSAGSLGCEAQLARGARPARRRTRGSARRRRGERAQRLARRGRTVTRPICGTLKPLGRAPPRPATAAAARPAPAGAARRGRGVERDEQAPGAAARRGAPDAGASSERGAEQAGRTPAHRADHNPPSAGGDCACVGDGRERPAESQKPSANFASSDILSGVHGGVKIIDDVTSLDALELADELLDLLGDLRPDRAARRGERERHVDVAGRRPRPRRSARARRSRARARGR